jgi:hypothetical protein
MMSDAWRLLQPRFKKFENGDLPVENIFAGMGGMNVIKAFGFDMQIINSPYDKTGDTKFYLVFSDKIIHIEEDLDESFFHADQVRTLSTSMKPVYVEIFRNPSPKELIDLKQEYRLIRCGVWNGDLYAWRGNILHDNAKDIMKDKIGMDISWDYRMIYDPSKSNNIEVYGDEILSDGETIKLISRIFPQVKHFVSADTDEIMMTIES